MSEELPRITISEITDELVNKLKGIISSLYLPNNGAGRNIISQAVKHKFDLIASKSLPQEWVNFGNDLEKELPSITKQSQISRNFPNYSYTFFIEDKTVDGIQSIILLKLKMSLLCNYFTVYYETHFVFTYLPGFLNGHPIRQMILSGTQQEADPDSKTFKSIVLAFQKNFPDFLFADPVLLLSYHVEGITPLGGLDDVSYRCPIFTYLFDNDYLMTEYKLAR